MVPFRALSHALRPRACRPCLLAAGALLLLGASRASAQPGPESPAWSVDSVRAPAGRLQYTATEGTWMSVDVSPDGRHLVFDLLGHIYELPVAGGEARALTAGHAWNTYPRYSPDGTRIAFTSDRGGTSALWLLERASGAVERVSTVELPVMRPTWSADGRHLYGSVLDLHSRTKLHRFNFHGKHQELTGAPGRWSAVYAAVEDTARGRIYFTQAGERLPASGERIVAWDMRTGEARDLVRRPGGAGGAVLSPDASRLAFVGRDDRETILMLHDLESGRQRVLARGIDHDRQEGLATEGAYPAFAWHPDGREVFISLGGGLHAIDAETGAIRGIPFRAPVDRAVERTVRFPVDVPAERARTRYHGWAQRTDRGIVFAALGDLHLLGPGGRVALTDDTAIETSPVYDAGTRTLYYASWDDAELGAIQARRLPDGPPARLTTVPAQYGSLTLSRDGRSLAYLRGSNRIRAGEKIEDQTEFDLMVLGPDRVERRVAGIRWWTVSAANQSAKQPPGMTFSPDGTELYFTEFVGDSLTLRRIPVAGGAKETLYYLPEAVRAVVSPDLRWIAFREFSRSYVAPYEFVGKLLTLTAGGGSAFARRIDADDGEFTEWSADGGALYWTRGTGLYEKTLADVLADEAVPARRTELAFEYDVHAPEGTLALTGARVLTMNAGREVIEDATVIVRGGRIEAVGRDVPVPADAHVLDLAGRTIIPGLIDSHAHYGGAASPLGVVEQTSQGLAANLAHGVTTMYEVYGVSHKDFLVSDLQRAGRSVGSRLFSVGTPIFGLHYRPKMFREIRSLDDAREHVRFNRDHGATSVKDYTQFSRAARQQTVAAARELGVNVVSETAADPQMNLTQLVDGVSGLEHTPGLTPFYEDFVRLFAATSAGMTPTLLVVYDGPAGEGFFHQRERVWEDPKLLRFFRPDELIRFRRPTHYFEDDVYALEMARELRKLNEAGVPLQIGGHGQMYGLDNHWEMELLVRGGFEPREVLAFATINSARYHGLDGHLGSIEPGKQADLVVLERNPLEDIRNTRAIEYVVQNGVVYDGRDLARIHPRPAPPPTLYFRRDERAVRGAPPAGGRAGR